MSKKMKKFWSLMLVALVTLGAAACSEKDENVDTKQEATVSFYAEIADDTRAFISDEDGDKTWTTTFEKDDVLMVNDKFEFTYEEGKFVCNKDGVQNIIGQEVTITGDFGDSTTGKNAVKIAEETVTFTSGMNVKLTSELSFFMFNYTGELKLTASENIFKANGTAAKELTLTAKEGEPTFVAFYPTGEETNISYSIDGVTCKETTINFTAGKVYNLGTLEANLLHLVPSSDWKSAKAWFAAYFFGTGGDTWVKMVDGNEDGTYTVLVPEGEYANVIFGRKNPASADLSWDNNWGKTQDMVISLNDTCGIAGWNSGVWKSEWSADNVYLNSMINGDWKTAHHFAIWTWGSGDKWVDMTKTNKSGLYYVAKSNLGTGMLFTAMKAATNDWGNKTQQTGDLTKPTNNANIYDVNNSAWVTATFN